MNIAIRPANLPEDYDVIAAVLAAEEGYNIDMTGVLRPYRGRGVATLLKLRGIRYAQAHGNRPLYTVNDSANTACWR